MSSPSRRRNGPAEVEKPGLPIPVSVDEEKLVMLGTISRPQGHLGEMRMIPVFDDPRKLGDLRGDRLYVRIPRQGFLEARLLGWRVHGGRYLVVRLDLAPDMNAAETLRRAEVYTDPDTLWLPEEGEWFSYEVVGFDVVDSGQENRMVGKALGLSDGAAHSYLLVQRPVAGPPMLIPVVPELIERVDKESRTIIVQLPPGLDEL
jgi:16S rRNA processing protein RimM